MDSTVTGRPYKQWKISQNVLVRVFPRNTNVHELVWHRDHHDRQVTVLEGNNWLFQYDNEIPRKLTDGHVFEITKGHYHRLIRGDGELYLKIIEKNRPF
jgi:hypothetical protein